MNVTDRLIKLSPPKENEKEFVNGVYVDTSIFKEETIRGWLDEIVLQLKEQGHIPETENVEFLIQCVPLNLVNLTPGLISTIEYIETLKRQGKYDERKLEQYQNEALNNGFSYDPVKQSKDKKYRYSDSMADFLAKSILLSNFQVLLNPSLENQYLNNIARFNKLVDIIKYSLEGGMATNKFVHKLYSGKTYILSTSRVLINVIKGLNPDGSEKKRRIFNFDTSSLSESEITQKELELSNESETYRKEQIKKYSHVFDKDSLKFEYQPISTVRELFEFYKTIMVGKKIKAKIQYSENSYNPLEDEPEFKEEIRENFNQEDPIKKLRNLFDDCYDFVRTVVSVYKNYEDEMNKQNERLNIVAINGKGNVFITNLINFLDARVNEDDYVIYEGSNFAHESVNGDVQVKNMVKILCCNIFKIQYPELYKDQKNLEVFFSSVTSGTKYFYQYVSEYFDFTFDGDETFLKTGVENPLSFMNRCIENNLYENNELSFEYLKSVLFDCTESSKRKLYFPKNFKSYTSPENYGPEGVNLSFSVNELSDLIKKVVKIDVDTLYAILKPIKISLANIQMKERDILSKISDDIEEKYGLEVTVRAIPIPEITLLRSNPEYAWIDTKLTSLIIKFRDFIKENVKSLSESYYIIDASEDFEKILNGSRHHLDNSLDDIKKAQLDEIIQDYLKIKSLLNYSPLVNPLYIKNKNIGLEMNFLIRKLVVVTRDDEGRLIVRQGSKIMTIDDTKGALSVSQQEMAFFKNYFMNLLGMFWNVSSIDFTLVTETSSGYQLKDHEIRMTVKFVGIEDVMSCSKFYTRALASKIEDIRDYENRNVSVTEADDKYRLFFDKTSEQYQAISENSVATDRLYLVSDACKYNYPFMTKKYENEELDKILDKFRQYTIPRNSQDRFGPRGDRPFDGQNSESMTPNFSQSTPARSSQFWENFRNRIKKDVVDEYQEENNDEKRIIENYDIRVKQMIEKKIAEREQYRNKNDRQREDIRERNKRRNGIYKSNPRNNYSKNRSRDGYSRDRLTDRSRDSYSRDSSESGYRGSRGSFSSSKATTVRNDVPLKSAMFKVTPSYSRYQALDESEQTIQNTVENSKQREGNVLNYRNENKSDEEGYTFVRRGRKYNKRAQSKKSPGFPFNFKRIIPERSTTPSSIESPASTKSPPVFYSKFKQTDENRKIYKPRSTQSVKSDSDRESTANSVKTPSVKSVKTISVVPLDFKKEDEVNLEDF